MPISIDHDQKSSSSQTCIHNFIDSPSINVTTPSPLSINRPPHHTTITNPKQRKIYHFQSWLANMTLSIVPALSLFSFLLHPLLFTITNAATFDIRNQCSYTVWAAAVPGGGKQLDPQQTWTISANPGTTGARIWGRTGCTFDGNGRGSCKTGDCGGLLQCQAFGQPPNTLAEYALKQFSDLDFFDISLVDGFNIPMEFSPTSGGCTRGITCNANINGECPAELKATDGCNNPCTVFKTDEYCCNSGSCGPTNFSKFFKDRCPDAYSYPKDDNTSTFTCPTGANYKVVFCP